MDIREESLKKHYEWRGKIEVTPRAPVGDAYSLSLAYTPGVAQACIEIQNAPEKSFELTRRFNTVAVITDGTAVLGLGDIGPEAGMPVMEGKCVLFKSFGGVDAFPLCIKSKDVDEIVNTICLLEGSFGGINLEDISAPRCFEIERKLKERMSIPVFHDDQHGTAIVVGAGILNALKLTGRKIEEQRAVINGAGSAGIAVCKLLLQLGLKDIIMCDKDGALVRGADSYMNEAHKEIAELTNPRNVKGTLADCLKGADIFVGVSRPGLVTQDMIRSMADKPIVFAMANPTPEIMPEEAKAAGAAVVGTGRSDYPNQVNNVLAFPGVFRGALDVRATDINEEMKMAAARAIAALVRDHELSEDYVLPLAFDPRVCPAVSGAVALAAMQSGVAGLNCK